MTNIIEHKHCKECGRVIVDSGLSSIYPVEDCWEDKVRYKSYFAGSCTNCYIDREEMSVHHRLKAHQNLLNKLVSKRDKIYLTINTLLHDEYDLYRIVRLREDLQVIQKDIDNIIQVIQEAEKECVK